MKVYILFIIESQWGEECNERIHGVYLDKRKAEIDAENYQNEMFALRQTIVPEDYDDVDYDKLNDAKMEGDAYVSYEIVEKEVIQ